MDLTRETDRYLRSMGFDPVGTDDNRDRFYSRRGSETTGLLILIPPRLAGQKKDDPEERDRVQEDLARKLMIRDRKPVRTQKLYLFSSLPEEKSLNGIKHDPEAWLLLEDEKRLLIFEDQRSDFFGIRAGLETVPEEAAKREKAIRRNSLSGTFTPVNTMILAVNLLVFLLISLMGSTEDPNLMERCGALSWTSVVIGRQYYRLITSMFLHFGPEHLLGNMLILVLLGSRLERITGKAAYLVIYLISGISGGLASLYFTLYMDPQTVSAGASGAIFGVMGGLCAVLLAQKAFRQKRVSDRIGMRGILFMIASALYYGFTDGGVDNAAHLGGLAGGFVSMLLMIFVFFCTQNRRKSGGTK